MNTHFSFQRLVSVARKESLHILRDPGTLFFALFIPVLELFMLGYAIDTNIRDVSTVILDQCKTTESRALIRRFETSTSFKVLPERIYTDEQLTQAIVAGRAHVGIKIPENYSRNLGRVPREKAQILVTPIHDPRTFSFRA